jgi:predicted dehydrogenase
VRQAGDDAPAVSEIKPCGPRTSRLRAPEASDQKQAAWRTDPARSGAAGCFGDIATHAFNLARYTTGLLPEKISCHLRSFEQGRKLDDYGTAVIQFQNGGLGTVTSVATVSTLPKRS